jgi:PAS domain-containing protein
MATKKVVKRTKKRASQKSSDLKGQDQKRLVTMRRKEPDHLPQDGQKSLQDLRKQQKELEKQNEQLCETQKRLGYLASFPEMNPNPVVGATVDGSIQYLNPAAQHLFPDLQTMGSRHEWLVDLKSIATLLRDNENTSYVREIRIGNAWFEQLFFLAPTQDEIRVYSRDITERKQAEEALSAIQGEADKDRRRLEAVMEARGHHRCPGW